MIYSCEKGFFLSKIYYKTLFFITVIAVLYFAVTVDDHINFEWEYLDKLKHAFAFFTLSLLLNRSSSTYDARLRNVTALLLFGIFIEIIQLFIPYRDSSVYDVIADMIGIFTFQTVLSFYRYTKSLYQPIF